MKRDDNESAEDQYYSYKDRSDTDSNSIKETNTNTEDEMNQHAFTFDSDPMSPFKNKFVMLVRLIFKEPTRNKGLVKMLRKNRFVIYLIDEFGIATW